MFGQISPLLLFLMELQQKNKIDNNRNRNCVNIFVFLTFFPSFFTLLRKL